jgi:hypothetical protein
MDSDEFLERSHPAEAEPSAFSSPKWLVRIFRTIVEPATGFAIVR